VSKVTGAAHWICDRCGADGGVVDEHETYPYRWLALIIRVGAPQLRSEQAHENTVHLCDGCGENLLFRELLAPPSQAPAIERLRSLWLREAALETKAKP
jgi:hypothetical protein